MIRFITVHDHVIVSEGKSGHVQMAFSGLELDETIGNYLIATTKTSSAQISAGGKSFSLPQASYVAVGLYGTTWIDKHYNSWGHDFRLLIGNLWWLIAGDPRIPFDCWGGGVRG